MFQRPTRGWYAALLCGAVAVSAVAQDPAEAGAKKPDEAAAKEAAATQDPQPQDPGTSGRVFATLKPETTALRCFETDQSPKWEDSLPKGAVVLVGETRGNYSQVFLPLGMVGYVHSDFVTEFQLEGDDAGTVATKADRVSFRYRVPLSPEPPVTRLPKGAKLNVLERKGEWLRVRQIDQAGWVPTVDMIIVDPPTPTVEKAWKALEGVHRDAATKLVRERIAADAAARRRAEQKAKVEEIRKAYDAQLATPVKERSFDDVEKRLAALLQDLGETSDLRPRVVAMQADVQQQRWVAQAVTVLDEQPKGAEKTVRPSRTRDPLESYDAVGWLVHHRSSTGTREYSIEKAGQTLFWVTCSEGRFDLDTYDGVEVALKGPSFRPTAESLRVLDAQKILVLSTKRR